MRRFVGSVLEWERRRAGLGRWGPRGLKWQREERMNGRMGCIYFTQLSPTNPPSFMKLFSRREHKFTWRIRCSCRRRRVLRIASHAEGTTPCFPLRAFQVSRRKCPRDLKGERERFTSPLTLRKYLSIHQWSSSSTFHIINSYRSERSRIRGGQIPRIIHTPVCNAICWFHRRREAQEAGKDALSQQNRDEKKRK